MNTYAIRNEKQRSELIDYIKQFRLPFRLMIQDIHPKRSVDFNAYYWVIVTEISEYCGYSPLEMHKILKSMFLIGYFPDKNGVWSFRIRSTTELDTKEFADYVMKIHAWATTFLCIVLPERKDIFINEDHESLV